VATFIAGRLAMGKNIGANGESNDSHGRLIWNTLMQKNFSRLKIFQIVRLYMFTIKKAVQDRGFT
jgi:hypothetical protein